MRILIVDDSPSELMVLRARLQRLGHDVVTAPDGKRGLQAYHDARPDLVLLDVVMPDIDGHETARRLRASEAEWVPIIFLSGRTESADIAAGIEAGGDDYLSKPCEPVVLSAKMRSMQRIAAMRATLLDTTRELERANDALARAAQTDGLTGVGNRRALDAALMREVGRAARARSAVSVLLADVDHFKKYNDRHGHLAGDECLRRVAAALADTVTRPADFLGRYGGEEFCLVLPETPATGAMNVAERARAAVESLAPLGAPAGDPVTASIGVASMLPTPGSSPASVLAQADAALYEAKRLGRNRCVHVIQLSRPPAGEAAGGPSARLSAPERIPAG